METNVNLKTAPEYIYVDNAESLGGLVEALGGTARVGLDTEADSLHHYFEKVCLIQLSFSGANYIVDPLAGLSPEAFLETLSQKELIIQGADYDLRMLKKTFGFRPKAPVFDTMLAAQVLGYEKIGLEALVGKCCGAALTHGGQKSDWSRRPLSQGQLRYAADDTRYLEAIADVQTAALRELGREAWHRECCARVVESAGQSEKSDEGDAWRIKGSSKIAPKALVFLREIWKWRDEIAQKKDRPPFMILKNEELLELAGWKSFDPDGPLQGGPKFLKRITGENLERLEKALRTAQELSPAEWPVTAPRFRSQEEGPSREKVEALLAACKAIANGLRIEPCFLASRATVTAAVRHQPRTPEEAQKTCGMMRWQAELLMPATQTVLGKAS
jgi:ribonuclease D